MTKVGPCSRGLFAVVSAAVALVLLTTPVARADDSAPEITSLRRTSVEVLGSDAVVALEFSAVDEGPAGLTYALFTYATPLGGELRVDSPYMNRDTQGTYTAVRPVGLWAASGNYTLEKAEVLDLEGNRTVYERNGSPPFDFAAADFRVDNPLEDTTTPTISFVKLFQPNVRQGTPVVVLYGANDDLSGVEQVTVSVWSPTGKDVNIQSLPGLGAAGPATWVVPLASPAGLYDAFSISAFDRAGNHISYRVDGSAHPYPPKATIPNHDHPDPDAVDFTVEGVVGDRTAPQLTSFSMLTPKTRHLGGQVALDYSASDEGTGVWQVRAEWSDGRGHHIEARKTCDDVARGPVTTTIEDYRSLDTDWQMQSFSITDYLNNQADYYRDGHVGYQGGDAGPSTHDFDLSQADFHLESGPADRHDYPRMEWCPNVADVSLEVPDPFISYGETVTPVGSVEVAKRPIADPLVAVHEYGQGDPRLTAVVAGDEGGAFETSFVATQNTTLKATFLGVAGPFGSDATPSPDIDIVVHPRVQAAFARHTYRVGHSAALTGSVAGVEEGTTVALQQRTRRGWLNARRTHVAEDGTFEFVIHPQRPGVVRYRAEILATASMGRGVSPTQKLKILPDR